MEPMDIVGKAKEDASLPKGLFFFYIIPLIYSWFLDASNFCFCLDFMLVLFLLYFARPFVFVQFYLFVIFLSSTISYMR